MLIAFALASALLPQEAPQAAPAQTQPAPAAAPAESPERVVCRREYVTGSNRPRRVCSTVREREEVRDSSQRLADRIQERPATPIGRDGGGG